MEVMNMTDQNTAIDEVLTFAQFAKDHEITLTSTYKGESNWDDEGGTRRDSWECVIHCGGDGYIFEYHTGLGHRPDRPDLDGVLGSLQLDARCGDHPTFEDFASEFGYDTDSRRAERTYRTCQEVYTDLANFFSSEFDTFMSCQEG